MREGYRKIIQDHDAEMTVALQKALAEAERRDAEDARAQAAVDAWFGTIFRAELDLANEAMRGLNASLLVTDTRKIGGKARHRLEFRRNGRLSPPYMLIVGDGEFSVVQHSTGENGAPRVNEQSDVAHFSRLGMGTDDEWVPEIIETMIAESLRTLR